VRGGELHPFRTLRGIFRDTAASQVGTGKIILRAEYSLLSRQRIELRGLLLILSDPVMRGFD
jgi:hypothetical protein